MLSITLWPSLTPQFLPAMHQLELQVLPYPQKCQKPNHPPLPSFLSPSLQTCPSPNWTWDPQPKGYSKWVESPSPLLHANWKQNSQSRGNDPEPSLDPPWSWVWTLNLDNYKGRITLKNLLEKFALQCLIVLPIWSHHSITLLWLPQTVQRNTFQKVNQTMTRCHYYQNMPEEKNSQQTFWQAKLLKFTSQSWFFNIELGRTCNEEMKNCNACLHIWFSCSWWHATPHNFVNQTYIDPFTCIYELKICKIPPASNYNLSKCSHCTWTTWRGPWQHIKFCWLANITSNLMSYSQVGWVPVSCLWYLVSTYTSLLGEIHEVIWFAD